ncbi:hypothetical protein SAMN05216188_117109 [Lentzea xinjiangensis]|uniref:Helicase ATP-binding domain-containing protein n=1 Tax=Lentzea xinjiangensis TaxID=402600 RepID=A0A1H9T2H2_9PSEU|nr:hypothetical protein [Lentzea xinjiangensis]SER91316.1 hypothetical protein SAMN05216188_117109 [Lentzea xinjiangensis]
MKRQDPVLPQVIEAAVALAAAYLPTDLPAGGAERTTRRKDVCFVLDGHVDSWSEWAGLTPVDARRFGRLLRRRPNDLANAEVSGPLLDRLLRSGELPGCRPAEGYDESGIVVVSPGMPLAEHVDRCLDLLDTHLSSRTRFREQARPGPHHSTLRTGGRRVVDARYDLLPHHVGAPQPPPAVVDAPELPHLRVPLAGLADVADRLDRVHATEYRSKSVARFRERVRDHHGNQIVELDMAAGELNQLLAYTGFGKSVVMIEVFACWAAEHGLVVSFVLPNNSDVMKAAHFVECSFERLGIATAVTPLVSPRSMIQIAEATTGVNQEWLWRKLGYGCALAATTTEDAVDAWQPGREPCGWLKRPAHGDEPSQLAACPFRASCDRFKLVRAALTAGVVITSHGNFHLGVLQYPVDDGFGTTEHLSVEELLLRRSHVVVIDEVDTFQNGTLDQAGRGLLLDQAGHTDTPLRRFDSEFGRAFGLVREDVDANVRDAHAVLRYLSEIYVSHLAYDRLGPARTAKAYRVPQRAWIVPRRWDRWLTSQLFEVDDTLVTPDQLRVFEGLYDTRNRRRKGDTALLRGLRHHLSAVVDVGNGASNVNGARARIDALLAKQRRGTDGKPRPGVVADGVVRARVVSLMIRRALLEKIRFHLHRLMNNSSQLVDVGVESMQAIADALGTYGRWRVVPTGPLGRLVFAFTEYLDTENVNAAWLRTAAFGGDPHVYVPRIGDVTALAHTGVRRIVVGLSATAYFPRAPQHHVHVRPRWYVRDDTPGSDVEVKAAQIFDGDEAIRVSGRSGPDRAEATRVLARLLWVRELEKELVRLQEKNDDRARVLLATTSYESAVHIAEGLVSAGATPWRICVATRPSPDNAQEADEDPPDNTWQVLPADQLDRFPQLRADVLIAPLARVQRGVNIIGSADRSALGSVWLVVRPIPLIDEPAELLAHIQAKALREHGDPAGDPLDVLAARRKEAGRFFDDITSSLPYFRTQPEEVRVSVAAEIVNGAIQLIGRARRGGTSATLHLVDGAFLNAGGKADLATLLQLLRKAWQADGELDFVERLYGKTLEALFKYADEHGQLTSADRTAAHNPENRC